MINKVSYVQSVQNKQKSNNNKVRQGKNPSFGLMTFDSIPAYKKFFINKLPEIKDGMETSLRRALDERRTRVSCMSTPTHTFSDNDESTFLDELLFVAEKLKFKRWIKARTKSSVSHDQFVKPRTGRTILSYTFDQMKLERFVYDGHTPDTLTVKFGDEVILVQDIKMSAANKEKYKNITTILDKIRFNKELSILQKLSENIKDGNFKYLKMKKNEKTGQFKLVFASQDKKRRVIINYNASDSILIEDNLVILKNGHKRIFKNNINTNELISTEIKAVKKDLLNILPENVQSELIGRRIA